jgi:Protein of unknown function (DUF998)
VTSWVVAGALRAGYDPVHDAISRLAEIGAPDRLIVTSGMVIFGLGCLIVAPGWERAPRIALLVAGLSSFGVAAFPCTEGCPGSGSLTDTMHSVMAGIHYVALVTTPFLAGPAFWGPAAAVLAALALSAHVWGPGPNGLMQRIGLTTLDVWLIGRVVSERRES